MSLTSPLEALGYPLFFPVDAGTAGLSGPSPRLATAQRTRVRALAGMQKEALVTDVAGTTWRLASDEGDYLAGDDVAPCPLAFMTTGMTAGYDRAIRRLARDRGVGLADLVVVCDNYYTMTGSALRGDMTGGALAPEVTVRVEADADGETVRTLVDDAITRAPATGLLAGALENRFALSLNGEPVETRRVAPLDAPPLERPGPAFEAIPRTADEQDPPLGRNTGRRTEAFTGDRGKYTGGASSSLAAEQDRVLHLRGTATRRDDGLTAVEVELYSPRGSVFELVAADDVGAAPTPEHYAAAGLGFCFMTQFGRYADIVDRALDGYEIVQETHLAAGDDGRPAEAAPVETHVFLDSPEGPAFAREVLDMAEQTCFLHALCRTDLAPEVSVTVG